MHQTNDQLNFGGHSRKFAYYFSATGNRTDLGLEPPTRDIDHATGSGEGLFTSMNYRLNEKNQFAWTASARKDRFQIPVDPNEDPTSDTYFGTRDIDRSATRLARFPGARRSRRVPS